MSIGVLSGGKRFHDPKKMQETLKVPSFSKVDLKGLFYRVIPIVIS